MHYAIYIPRTLLPINRPLTQKNLERSILLMSDLTFCVNKNHSSLVPETIYFEFLKRIK